MSSAVNTNDSNNKRKQCSELDDHLQQRGKIILLGDSITQMSFSAKLSGWGSYVADIYQRRCDVYNRGMSGYNTDWFLKFLDTKEGHYDVFGMMGSGSDSTNTHGGVKLVTIFFGANDASCEKLNPRHHVPLSRFETNLKEIVKKCKEKYAHGGDGDSNVKFIFITPPPVCHKSRLEFQIQRFKEKATGELERSLSLSGDYANAVVRVAKELDIPCLNIWKEMQEEYPSSNSNGEKEGNGNGALNLTKKPWSIYLSDGLHLSREGNLFVGEKLVNLIAKEYPEIAVTPCPFTDYTGNSSSKGGFELGSESGIGPWHDEIDHLDVESAFKPVQKVKVLKN